MAPGSALTNSFGVALFSSHLRIAVGDRDDVGGLAFERNFARPGEGRTPRLAGLDEGLSIRVHFLVAELANDAAGQDALDENIIFQNHVVAGRTAQRLEDVDGRLRPFRPLQRPDDRLHVRDSLDGLGMPRGPVKAQRRAPVVHDERDVALEIEALEERVEMARVIDEAIRAGRRRSRRAHPDEIRRDASRDAARGAE